MKNWKKRGDLSSEKEKGAGSICAVLPEKRLMSSWFLL
jgi:hypothetical protein